MYNVEIAKNDKFRLVAAGASCTVSIQDITVGTTTELKYYSNVSAAWVAQSSLNPMVVSSTDTSIYFYVFDASVIATAATAQQFLILTRDSTGSLIDAMVLFVGSSAQNAVARIGYAVAPYKKTISRTTDTEITVSSYSDTAGTKEVLRYDIQQDTSGNQPEETQIDTSSLIS